MKYKDERFNGDCPLCGQPFLREAVDLLREVNVFFERGVVRRWDVDPAKGLIFGTSSSDIEDRVNDYLKGIK